MNRRAFITLLGGAAAWPLAAWAQQPAEKLPRIGSIQNFRNENFEAFIQGLREAGYVDGQNMLLETRFYAGMLDRIDEFASELVALKCSAAEELWAMGYSKCEPEASPVPMTRPPFGHTAMGNNCTP